jgi:hypothetical protein
MQQRSIGFFIHSSAVLFLLTGGAKLISGNGTARILNNLDPVFLISFRHILYAAAVAELSVAAICLFNKNRKLQAGLIAMLATNFMLYRFGLYWQGYRKTCNCLGDLTDALHIPPQITDTTMKIILAYLLLGSYATLFWLWKEKRKATLVTPSSEKPTVSAS